MGVEFVGPLLIRKSWLILYSWDFLMHNCTISLSRHLLKHAPGVPVAVTLQDLAATAYTLTWFSRPKKRECANTALPLWSEARHKIRVSVQESVFVSNLLASRELCSWLTKLLLQTVPSYDGWKQTGGEREVKWRQTIKIKK